MSDGLASDCLSPRTGTTASRPGARVHTGGNSAVVRGPHLTGVVPTSSPGCTDHQPPRVVAATPLSAAAPPGAAQAPDARRLATAADENEVSRAGHGRPAPRLLPFVRSTSLALHARRTRVAGGAEELPLAPRTRSSKRRRHDAYAAPRWRWTARAIRAALRSPARTAVVALRDAALSGARPRGGSD